MKFSDFVDLVQLRALCESFTALSGAVTAILDLEGNILVATGWQDVCMRFHRVHPGLATRCRESDTALAGMIGTGQNFSIYPCKNGLIDVAMPIVIGDEHVANFFTGQFFMEPPDDDYFRRQAAQFGLPEAEYIEAMHRVPVFSQAQIEAMTNFFSRLAHMIGEMGLTTVNMEKTVAVRTAELSVARDAAEAASKAKSVFLANMSHELRTPLNAILGFSNLMRREPDVTAGQIEKLDIINRAGEHLLALINDVLEMAKIESGRVHLEIVPFDLGTLVRDVTDMMRLRALEKGLSLLLDQSSSFPRFIKGDPARLRQILVNLLGNAVKFTEQGGVTIRLGTRRDDRQHLLMEIEDSGIGIGSEDQQRLFQPFVQVVESGTQEGTGLGLAITRQFVELMGGAIGVTSTPGKGTIFRVELPVEIATEADAAGQSPGPPPEEILDLAPGQPAFRILIAEDHRENQLLLMKLMADVGLEAKLAVNGEECVALFSEWRPHLIWMDRRMPVMDGVDATRRIRQLPDGRDVRIVAVTASVFKEERQMLVDAGMDDFVRKPYRFSEIYGCLARQLGVQFIPRTATRGEAAAERPAPDTLRPDLLASLPAELRARIREVVESLDARQIADVAQRVGEFDQRLRDTILSMVEHFDHQSILDALASVEASRK